MCQLHVQGKHRSIRFGQTLTKSCHIKRTENCNSHSSGKIRCYSVTRMREWHPCLTCIVFPPHGTFITGATARAGRFNSFPRPFLIERNSRLIFLKTELNQILTVNIEPSSSLPAPFRSYSTSEAKFLALFDTPTKPCLGGLTRCSLALDGCTCTGRGATPSGRVISFECTNTHIPWDWFLG